MISETMVYIELVHRNATPVQLGAYTHFMKASPVFRGVNPELQNSRGAFWRPGGLSSGDGGVCLGKKETENPAKWPQSSAPGEAGTASVLGYHR